MKSKTFLKTFLLFLLFVAVIFYALTSGPADITLKKIWSSLWEKTSSPERNIIFNLRLPRLLVCLAAGGILSISGVMLQAIFRNPLVEPYTLGISGGAALSTAFCIILKLDILISPTITPAFGFLGALATVCFVYITSSAQQSDSTNRMLLTGVMISLISSSLLMLIMSLAKSSDLKRIIFWSMGSISEPPLATAIYLLTASLLGLMFSYTLAIKLNAMLLGEEEARVLGINTENVKKTVIVLTSLLTGCIVSFTGIIGFVGLLVPHFIRLIFGYDHRILLINSFIAGSLFLTLCDTVAKTIANPLELPTGVITGICGGSIFIFTLIKNKREI